MQSEAWAAIGVLGGALLTGTVPAILSFKAKRSTDQVASKVGNGFAEDVLTKLDHVIQRQESVMRDVAYARGQLDMHIAGHARTEQIATTAAGLAEEAKRESAATAATVARLYEDDHTKTETLAAVVQEVTRPHPRLDPGPPRLA